MRRPVSFEISLISRASAGVTNDEPGMRRSVRRRSALSWCALSPAVLPWSCSRWAPSDAGLHEDNREP